MSDDIVERLRSLSILDGWLPMMEEAAVEIDRQRKVISAMIEDCQYLKDKQIEAADEIEKLRAALVFYADDDNWRLNGPLDANSGNFTGGPAKEIVER